MIRIGIIGTESSHAGAFSQIINCPRSDFADMHVAALYGPDRATAEAVADVCGGACIADSLQKLTAQVDAVMITARKRSLHYAYALPLIEQKMPLFIDKPLPAVWNRPKNCWNAPACWAFPYWAGPAAS